MFNKLALAGNIVPAIATTNAVIAGLLVLEAVKVIKGDISACKMIHCVRAPSMMKRKQCFLYPVGISKPNPDCYICSSNFLTIQCNCDITTLGYFVNEILKKNLSMIQPLINVGDNLIYEYDEDMEDDEKEDMQNQLSKMLHQVGIVNNTAVVVEDYAAGLSWKINMIHDASALEVNNFKVLGKSQTTTQKKRPQQEQQTEEEGPQKSADNNDDGVIMVIDDEEKQSKKRKRQADAETVAEERPAKKPKTSNIAAEDLVEID